MAKLVKEFKAHEDSTYALEWTNKGILLTGSVDESTKAWNTDSLLSVDEAIHEPLALFKHRLSAISISTNHDSSLGITSSIDGTVSVFDISNAGIQENVCLNLGVLNVWKSDLHPYETLIVAGTHLGNLNILNFSKLKGDRKLPVSSDDLSSSIAVPNGNFIMSVSFSGSGDFVGCGDFAGGVNVFDSNKEVSVAKLDSHHKAVRGISFVNSSDHHLFTCSDDQHVNFYDLKSSGNTSKSWSGHSGWVTSVATHPSDGNLFLTSCSDGEVRLFDRRKDLPIFSINGNGESDSLHVWDVSFSPEGNYICCCDDSGFVRVFSYA